MFIKPNLRYYMLKKYSIIAPLRKGMICDVWV